MFCSDESACVRRHRHVSAPAILITGDPSLTVRERARKASVPIVEKPLLGNALLQKIRDVNLFAAQMRLTPLSRRVSLGLAAKCAGNIFMTGPSSYRILPLGNIP
jgi:hypothetical protein